MPAGDARPLLYAVGKNANGEHGLGHTRPVVKLARVPGSFGRAARAVSAVSCGGNHTMVLLDNGSLWAAGFNGVGQCGVGDTSDRHRLVRVPPPRGSPAAATGAPWHVTRVSAGFNHTWVVDDGGALASCGFNGSGQLGLGDGAATHEMSLQVGTTATGVIGQETREPASQAGDVALGRASVSHLSLADHPSTHLAPRISPV
jgi:alpha-tubulin suppressor-like RCC1 family protein